MAKTIGEAINLLSKIEQFNLIGMEKDMNQTTKHRVNHKYREVIIIPLIGLTENIDFLLSKGDKYLMFSDGTEAKVTEYKEVHICEEEEEIKQLYGCDPWRFIKKWYSTNKEMDSMHFLRITTKKIENNGE